MVFPRLVAWQFVAGQAGPGMRQRLDRYHWRRSLTPGLVTRFPGMAVRVLPTLAVPDTVGVAAFNVPAVTAAVGAEVLEVVVNPAFLPVTRTVMVFPMSLAVSL